MGGQRIGNRQQTDRQKQVAPCSPLQASSPLASSSPSLPAARWSRAASSSRGRRSAPSTAPLALSSGRSACFRTGRRAAAPAIDACLGNAPPAAPNPLQARFSSGGAGGGGQRGGEAGPPGQRAGEVRQAAAAGSRGPSLSPHGPCPIRRRGDAWLRRPHPRTPALPSTSPHAAPSKLVKMLLERAGGATTVCLLTVRRRMPFYERLGFEEIEDPQARRPSSAAWSGRSCGACRLSKEPNSSSVVPPRLLQEFPRPLQAELFWGGIAARLAVNDECVAMRYSRERARSSKGRGAGAKGAPFGGWWGR